MPHWKRLRPQAPRSHSLNLGKHRKTSSHWYSSHRLCSNSKSFGPGWHQLITEPRARHRRFAFGKYSYFRTSVGFWLYRRREDLLYIGRGDLYAPRRRNTIKKSLPRLTGCDTEHVISPHFGFVPAGDHIVDSTARAISTTHRNACPALFKGLFALCPQVQQGPRAREWTALRPETYGFAAKVNSPVPI